MSTQAAQKTANLQDVEQALELEQLDTDIFRSVRLWKPLTGRGAFGGQIIAQSVRASGKTVETGLCLHSFHCYFLTFGDVEIPVLYMVDRLRSGRSYATRTVTAIQRGKPIFTLIASFQRPEPEQPRFQVDMDSLTSEGDIFKNLPGPDECVALEDSMQALITSTPDMSERMRRYYINSSEERRLSSIEIRSAHPHHSPENIATRDERDAAAPSPQQAIWFRSRVKLPADEAFHKCVLAYASDFAFIGTAGKALGLHSRREPRLGMMASLDHSMHFYNSCDPSEWLLFVMEAQAASNGRGLVRGRIYTRDGKLAVVVQQEGVVRQQMAPKL